MVSVAWHATLEETSPARGARGQVDAIKTKQDLEDMLAYLMTWNTPPFFALNVAVGVRAPPPPVSARGGARRW